MRGSAWVYIFSLASRGIIEKKTVISSDRADTKDSRAPSEATQDSEQKENQPGTGGPREEANLGLVDKKKNIAEGDASNLAREGTSDVPSNEGTKTSKAADRNGLLDELANDKIGGKGTAEGESSNLADKPVHGVSAVRTEDPERIDKDSAISTSKRKQEDTSDSETAKKLKSNHADNVAAVESGGQKLKTDLSGGGKNGACVQPEIEERSMRLAVVLVGFPDVKMTEEQAEVVETALVEKINPADHGEPIQFSAAQYENGGLAFTCDNKTTKVWLHKIVPKLVPWPGARLAVGTADFTLKGTKFVIWLMRVMRKRDNKQILNLLQKQNKDISTAEWRILRRVVEGDKRERLTLWVDDKSFEDLKPHNFKLFLGLGRANLMLWSEWKKLLAKTNLNKTRPTVQHPQPQRKLTNYKPRPQNFRPNLPQSRGSRFSNPNLPRPREPRFVGHNRAQHSGPLFSDLELRNVRQVQFMARNRALLQDPRYMDDTIQQNRVTDFIVSEHSRQPQSRESRYFDSDQLQEPRYMASDHNTRYVVSEQSQPLEARYLISDQLPSRGSMFVASDQPQSRENRYVTSDQPFSRESRYVDQPPSRNSRYVHSNQAQSRDSRFRGSDEPQFHESRIRGSDHLQSREGRFVEPDPPMSRESRLRMSDPQQFREGRVAGANSHQLQQSMPSYTSLTHSRFLGTSNPNRANFGRFS